MELDEAIKGQHYGVECTVLTLSIYPGYNVVIYCCNMLPLGETG